jgi:hypothetical protein
MEDEGTFSGGVPGEDEFTRVELCPWLWGSRHDACDSEFCKGIEVDGIEVSLDNGLCDVDLDRA